jgi:hypothetical protein
MRARGWKLGAVTLAVLALTILIPAAALASPGAGFCANCHSGAGPEPTVTQTSTDATTATYSITQPAGGKAWAVFAGNTQVADGLTATGTFTVPLNAVYKAFSVSGFTGPIGVTDFTAGQATQTFTVTPSASAGGTISPSTPQTVESGKSVTFTFTPSSGYHIMSVLVDNVAQVPAPTSYTFSNVTADHKVSVTFSNAAAARCDLSLYSSVSRIRRNHSVTLSGVLESWMDLSTFGQGIRYEVKKPGFKTWSLIRTCTTNPFGATYTSYKPTKVGTYSFRASFLGTADLAAGTSPVVKVVVRR